MTQCNGEDLDSRGKGRERKAELLLKGNYNSVLNQQRE